LREAASSSPTGGKMLKEGTKAPAFTVADDQGNKVSLKDYAGVSNVVLFFYPKADTPG
jgi:thioredoxin-dependent peroxiredoxin